MAEANGKGIALQIIRAVSFAVTFMRRTGKNPDQFIFLWGKWNDVLGLIVFCPQAGLALPFPFDEKEAKILSKRTLSRAF